MKKKPEAERNHMPSGITKTAYATFKPPTVEIQGIESLPAHYKACLRKKKSWYRIGVGKVVFHSRNGKL
jgi:hypothetical protein